jgi:hypothetical protein
MNLHGSIQAFTGIPQCTRIAFAACCELVVSWPPRLNGVPLELVLLGRLVRTEETQAAISIVRYDFRTR